MKREVSRATSETLSAPLDTRLGADPRSVRSRLVPAGVEVDPVSGAVDFPLFLSPPVCAGLSILEEWSPLWSEPGTPDWLLLGFSHSSYAVDLEAGRRVLSPGDVLFINPGSPRSRDAASRCLSRGDYLWFPKEAILAAIEEVDPTVREREEAPFLDYNVPLDPGTFLIERRLFQYLITTPHPEPLHVEEVAYEILGRCVRMMSSVGESSSRESTIAAHEQAVEVVKGYVVDNLTGTMQMGEIARAANVSPAHLRQIFRRRTGVSIHQYATDLRLKAAFDRLGDYRGNYTALGLDLGFCSGQHFNNAFHRRFGDPPRRLLRRLGSGGRGAFLDWLGSEPRLSRPDWPYVIEDS